MSMVFEMVASTCAARSISSTAVLMARIVQASNNLSNPLANGMVTGGFPLFTSKLGRRSGVTWLVIRRSPPDHRAKPYEIKAATRLIAASRRTRWPYEMCLSAADGWYTSWSPHGSASSSPSSSSSTSPCVSRVCEDTPA